LRFIDIAVAALIGTSAMIGMTTLSPKIWDATSQRLAIQSELRDSLLDHFERPGVPLLFVTQPQMICEVVSSWTNSGVKYSATVGGVNCSSSPPTLANVASVTVEESPEVILQSWKAAGG
jgi:hypothetical protein